MLHFTDKSRVFPREAGRAAFPLGGIGTGNISIGARGEFRDWEIWNRPGKGDYLPHSFFALWCKENGHAPRAKVLAARPVQPFDQTYGHDAAGIAGLPHFAHSSLKGEYPLVKVDLWEDGLPLKITLEAYTPLIPIAPEDSGLPGAVIRYRIRNLSPAPVEISLAGSLTNGVGFNGMMENWGGLKTDKVRGNLNRFRSEQELIGLELITTGYQPDDLAYGSMVLASLPGEATVKPAWYRGRWSAGAQAFWDEFSANGRLTDLGYGEPWSESRFETGSLARHETIAPGTESVLTFFLAWHFPNRTASWDQTGCACGDSACKPRTVQNHYARSFGDAWEVASYLQQNLDRLEGSTQIFHDALFGSSLPEEVLDCVSANIVTLRSTACMWLADGTFLGYEGCHDKSGCCEGNCTHVWNYAQTLAFLFPSLERNMREMDFLVETDEAGMMHFRAMQVFGEEHKWYTPVAVDGQLGCIMRFFREWRLSGNNDFLARLWPKAKLALDFAIREWDADRDGMIESEQHNTYDISFFGPNMMTGALFLGALRAGAIIASHLGDGDLAQFYRDLEAKSASAYDASLWNGEFYRQLIEDVNERPQQFGEGCLADQLLGQALAHLYGLGDLLPAAHLHAAMASIFKYNFPPDLRDHASMQRVYALNDEAGLLLCTWPRGGRPAFPMHFCDEVWTGIEYQVATELIYQGMIDEGLALVKAICSRYDGYKRNPWNEIECGHHYVRAMSSWGLLIALSGFYYNLADNEISFAPKVHEDDFTCLWTTGRGWGVYRQQKEKESGRIIPHIQVLGGNMYGIKVKAAGLVWTIEEG